MVQVAWVERCLLVGCWVYCVKAAEHRVHITPHTLVSSRLQMNGHLSYSCPRLPCAWLPCQCCCASLCGIPWCCRPEVLALHLHQWLYFFAPDGAPAEPGSKAEAQTLLRNRLAATPQLLAVNVENLVANLYEVGAIVHAEVGPLHSNKMNSLGSMAVTHELAMTCRF